MINVQILDFQFNEFHQPKNMTSKHNFLKRIVKYVYVSARVMGLRPYDYSTKTEKFTNSKFNTFLAVSICIICAFLHHLRVEMFIQLLKPSFKQTMLTVQSTYAIFYSNLLVFISIYIFQNIFKPQLLKLCLNAQKFQKKTKYIFKNNEIKYKKSLIIFLVKSFYIKLMVFGITTSCMKEGTTTSVLAIFITFPVVVIFSVANLFYGLVNGFKYYFEALNNKIQIILFKINLSNRCITKYEKSKLHCELSDQIDEIAILHSELCYITREFANIYHMQILVIFVNTFINIIIQVMIVCY